MQATDLTGRLISGRYELVALLGEGGFASVWKARQLQPEGWVAVKVLHAAHANDPELVRSFLREAALYVPFRDEPNVATILECGHDPENGVHFLVMTLLAETVAARVERDGPFAVEELLRLAEDMGKALRTVHGAGLVHRDVKCSNVMASPSGDRWVLTDFGLGLLREVAEKTVTAKELEKVGTWAYASPELIRARRREDITSSADWYSLGVVLYRAATGQYPFPPHFPQVIQHHLESTPPDPRRLRPDLPPPVAELILKLLSKDPARRFPNGASFLDALERIRRGRAQGIRGTQTPTWARLAVPLLLAIVVVILGGRLLPRRIEVPVESIPTGAAFSVSAGATASMVATGRTPGRVRLTRGAYTIRYTLAGHFPAEVNLDLSQGNAALPPARLEPAFAARITSEPPGARLLLVPAGGDPRGAREFRTPCTVPDLRAGPHALTLELRGRRTLVEEIEIGAGQEEFHRVLPPLGGVTLEVYSLPVDGARVWIDGGLVGERTPCRIPNVEPGRHALRLERSGFGAAETTLVLDDSAESRRLRFRLEPARQVEPDPVERASVKVTVIPAFAFVHIDGALRAINEDQSVPPWSASLGPGAHTFRILNLDRPDTVDVTLSYTLKEGQAPRTLTLDWANRRVLAE